MPEFPLLIELQTSARDVLVIVEGSDAKRNAVIGLRVELGAEKEGHLHRDDRPRAAHPPQLGDDGVEVAHVLQDVGGIDLVKVVVREGPGILVQVAQLVPAVIDGVEIHPALADIEAAADIEASRTGWRRLVHEERVPCLRRGWRGAFGWKSMRDLSSKAQFQDKNSRRTGKCSKNQNSG